MSRIYGFHPAHLFKAKGLPWSPEVLSGIVDKAGQPDWSVISCFSGNELQAVFAAKRTHGDVAECLALLCDGFRPIALQKGAITVMDYWTKTLKFRRLQATVKVGFQKGEDWLVSLGFAKEGVIKAYEPNCDHLLYGRVF